MDTSLLVSTHVSSLYAPSQVVTIPLDTARRDAPLAPAPAESDPPEEHATYSSTFHSETTGTLVLRLIHSGLTLELISLTTDVPPIRFAFPSPVLSAPGIFLFAEQELHILAVTATGSLFRVILPVCGGIRWHAEQLRGNWYREYIIKNAGEECEGVVHAQSTHCVVIGLPNGTLLRLETEAMGDDAHDGKSLRLLHAFAR
jgi:nuclear pore complex protein Nup160